MREFFCKHLNVIFKKEIFEEIDKLQHFPDKRVEKSEIPSIKIFVRSKKIGICFTFLLGENKGNTKLCHCIVLFMGYRLHYKIFRRTLLLKMIRVKEGFQVFLQTPVHKANVFNF